MIWYLSENRFLSPGFICCHRTEKKENDFNDVFYAQNEKDWERDEQQRVL